VNLLRVIKVQGAGCKANSPFEGGKGDVVVDGSGLRVKGKNPKL
jgi:hypothetical protein